MHRIPVYRCWSPLCLCSPFVPPSICWFLPYEGWLENRQSDPTPCSHSRGRPYLSSLPPQQKANSSLTIHLTEPAHVRARGRSVESPCPYTEGHKLMTWRGCEELALSTRANQLSIPAKPYTQVQLLHAVPHKTRYLSPSDSTSRHLWHLKQKQNKKKQWPMLGCGNFSGNLDTAASELTSK